MADRDWGFQIFSNYGYWKDMAAMKVLLKLMVGIIGITVLIACAGNQSQETEMRTGGVLVTPEGLKDIAGNEWYLKGLKINNESISLIKNTEITFSCDANGKVAGVATINRYFGSFSLKKDGEMVWNKAFGMTRRAGPPELMEQETRFMQALPQTSRLYIKKDILIATSAAHSTVLEFEKK
jgi:heat shock protein HslJ